MLYSPRLKPCLIACIALLAFALTAGHALAADKAALKSASAAAASPLPAAALDARLDELIEQLGSPQFTVRRSAANEIRKIGPEAFDRLHAATENSDPEIAASASYLLRQIAVRWTRSDDTAAVRRLMRGFSDQEDAERQRNIHSLAEMPGGEGVPALCRVARFDREPRLSRLAAMSIIQIGDDDVAAKSRDLAINPAIFDRELGESVRPPVEWLRQFQIQLQDPAQSVAGWQQLIDEESKRLDVEVNETSPAIVSALLWNLADVHRQLGQTDQLNETLDRVLAASGAESERMLGAILNWLLQRESWDALDQFADAHEQQIQKSKRTLYLLAYARSKQDKTDVADDLARQAAKRPPAKPLDGLDAAELLVALGQYDWAVREYQSGIDGQPVEAAVSIGARVELATLLQDYERYESAAEVLAPLMEAMKKNPDIVRSYSTAQSELAQQRHFLPEHEALSARYHYLRACHFEQEHNFPEQRKELLEAIQADETDADVLIAMYRLGDADDAWMKDTRERIQKLGRKVEEDIADNPNNPIPYNQWAWLIANTEGDFVKAVRYSRRSLDLEPDTASFLDTLGRCYFSAGEVDKAIESQRKAVALVPYLQVLKRQLKQFEKAKDEQGAK
jgi:tetratricopeptide (TPR) repeat protein